MPPSIQTLSAVLGRTMVEAPGLEYLTSQPPGFQSDTPFGSYQVRDPEPDTLETALGAYFTEHPERPPGDIMRDNAGAWPTPWVKQQTEAALILIAQAIIDHLNQQGDHKPCSE